ncbi:MAG: AsmA family protein, partial [Candidatus Omnitrophota bacterium]
IIKILLICFVGLILVLAAGAVIFIKTFDVNRYKPQIKSLASRALNRKVDFERANLGISLKQGISLKLNNLVIADDPAFQKDNFLTVKEVSLGIDALAYLFQRKVDVPNVLVDSAYITIIRQKDGSLNVQTIAKPAQAPKQEKSAPAAAPLAIPVLLINSLKLESGAVKYIDRSFEPALSLEVSQLNVSVSDISLTESFPFVVEAAVLSAKRNLKIEGRAKLDLRTNEVTVSDLKAGTELSQVLLGEIPAVFPMAKGAVLPQSLKGRLELSLDKLTAGPKGLSALTADASLTQAGAQFKELASPIKDIQADIRITGDKIIVDKASAAIGQGLINASGRIEDYLSRQAFNVEAQVRDLAIQELIVQDRSPVKAEGIVSCKIRINAEGFSPQALQSRLSGSLDLSVTKARIKNINVLRTVLDKISIIPGLAQKIEANLSERYKKKLTQKDTELSDIKLPVTIQNGQILVRDAVLGADEFVFKGRLQAGFDGAYSLEGSFLIPEELSGSMVSAVDQLQYLLNNDKQIYIPLRVTGRAGEVKFNVDTEYIAKKILEEQAKKQIFKALEKAFGKEEEPQEGKPEKPSPEKAIGDILRDIFR